MTKVQHFVSRLKNTQDEMYRQCSFMTLTFDRETDRTIKAHDAFRSKILTAKR